MADIGTSEWWLDRLGLQLDARSVEIQRLRDYYAGHHPLAFAGPDYRSAFANRFKAFSANFCRLVVQAVEERLTVTGFRLGATGQPAADTSAWAIWQDNQLDEQSQRAHREALISGEASVLVQPMGTGETPLIRIQDPTKVIIAYGDDPLERVVAMKRWEALDGTKLATLYYPDRLEKYQWTKQARDASGRYSGGSWEHRAVAGEPWPLPNPLEVVPIVPLLNDPSLDGIGTSEIASVVPLQDSLNKLILDMLLAAEVGAFRQRWATGIEIPVNPETGKPLEPWKAAIDRWASSAVPDAKFGTFDATDLTAYVRAIEQNIQIIASTTRTPPHYLLGQAGAFPSGESLRAAETGLVAKAHRRQRDYGEGWEEAIRLAAKAMGNTAMAGATDMETIWKDPETRTESQHVDAIVKKQIIGVPNEQLWEDVGYSPQQITRFKRMRAEEALLVPLPPVAPPIERLTVTSPSSTPPPADQTHLPMDTTAAPPPPPVKRAA